MKSVLVRNTTVRLISGGKILPIHVFCHPVFQNPRAVCTNRENTLKPRHFNRKHNHPLLKRFETYLTIHEYARLHFLFCSYHRDYCMTCISYNSCRATTQIYQWTPTNNSSQLWHNDAMSWTPRTKSCKRSCCSAKTSRLRTSNWARKYYASRECSRK